MQAWLGAGFAIIPPARALRHAAPSMFAGNGMSHKLNFKVTVDSQSPKTHKKPNLNLSLLSSFHLSWSLQGPGTCGSSSLLVNGARIQTQSEYSVYGRKRASAIVAVNHLALPRTLAR